MFKYLIKQPEHRQKNQKALLMLHGFGSNEADLFSFADQLPNHLLIISARAPLSLDFGGYAWYQIYLDAQNNKISDHQQAYEVLQQLADFIDFLAKKFKITAENFNLLGFSQGAILSYALALNYPDKIKNIVALSGYINEDIMPIQENLSAYKHLNFFISHGLFDDIIPIEMARQIPPYLEARAIKFDYHEYPMGHEVNTDCLQDMIHWMKLNF